MKDRDTSKGTYTIAVMTSTGMLLACIPDSGDIEAAVRNVEAEASTTFDRDDLTIESGLTLTDSDDCADTGEVLYSGSAMGFLSDEAGATYKYAVRLSSSDTKNEYAFDITLAAALRVKASSEADARAVLAEVMECADSNFGAWRNGDPILAEASLRGVPSLYEVNGETVEPTPPDPLELLRACVAAKTAYWDRLHDLEVSIAPNGEFSDRANDRMVDMIDDLAAGTNEAQPPVTEAHLLHAREIASL